MMQFSESLKDNYLFRRLYHRGRSLADRNLAIYCRKNGTGGNRIGFTVSAKLGCAVKRNLVRRRLREIYRLHEARYLPGYDMVFVVRGRAMQAQYRQLEASLLTLSGSLGLLKDERDNP